MDNLLARLRLTALWAALMFLYLYADIFSFYQPGELDDALAGRLGPYAVTQVSLFLSALLMAVPAAMVALTPLLPTAACRWTNLGIGGLYALVSIGNIIGESWAYYLFYGALEAVLTVSIAVLAYRGLRHTPAPT